ncbi:MAG: sigma 54-interacting transcriptional regulator [Planctomycetota bacterium]|nr:sigma 54-interacting transcriptional regulator [Planctomycetota bacterium]MDA0932017.1 sigma 54-interacting transcriptional regulator [Planctomycetota bacterium]MDA1220430.1 sigma 54-interacting transcriptional regulator [Planctomycetota bacterium]
MSDPAERVEPPGSGVVTPDFFRRAAIVGADGTLQQTNAAFDACFGPGRSTCHGAILGRSARCAVGSDGCPVARCVDVREPVHVGPRPPDGTAPCARTALVHALPIPGGRRGSETACLLVLAEPGDELDADSSRLLADTALVLGSDVSVLLEGETGTGKERLARAIHALHPRRSSAPFIAVDCADFRDGVLDSELFGHERGAFTGATAGRAGLIAAADGGTLFLDEVGDVPPHVQLKLLRLLEARTYRRVGSSESVPSDFRLICAAHPGLRAKAESGRLRWDFYYRVATFSLRLPALRATPRAIAGLARSLLAELGGAYGAALEEDAARRLAGLPFPGNVRELRHGLEQAWLRAGGGPIAERHLPEDWLGHDPAGGLPAGVDIVSLADAERQYLEWASASHRGDRRSLARILGISERSLYRKLRALDARSLPASD